MIDRSFIEKIEEMALKDKTIEVEGRKYSMSQITPIVDPKPASLFINTLTGIIDYLEKNPDTLIMKDIVIHVVGSKLVNVFSSLYEPWEQREGYLVAQAKPSSFSYGQYIPLENFIIGLQTYFVPSEETAKILKIVGNLTDGQTTNYNDDGVTQQVTAKTGIARVENVAVPNPVKLAPYRTFLEIEQPESQFLLRIKSISDAPACALFEADGGSWELEAIKRIKEWLICKVSTEVTILA